MYPITGDNKRDAKKVLLKPICLFFPNLATRADKMNQTIKSITTLYSSIN
jgi:hypothetical protein